MLGLGALPAQASGLGDSLRQASGLGGDKAAASSEGSGLGGMLGAGAGGAGALSALGLSPSATAGNAAGGISDRKSTRLNSSHLVISYAGFCFTKKTI